MASQKYFVINYELKYKRKFNYHVGEEFETISQFKEQISNSKAEYVLLGEPTHIQLEIVKEYFPKLLEHWQPLNVNYYLVAKSGSSTWAKYDSVKHSSTYFSQGKFEFNLNNKKPDGEVYTVDSLNEFCYSAKAELKNLGLKEGNVILAKVKLKSTEQFNDVGFNFSISDEKDSTLFFGGPDIGQFYTTDPRGYWAYSEIFVGSDLKHWLARGGKVTFFIWNRSKKKFSLSDFEIRIIDYWPARWSWWE